MGYETYRIADLIDEIAMGPFGSNIKVSCFVDSGVPVLNGSNLEGFSLSEKTFRYVTRKKADSLNKATPLLFQGVGRPFVRQPIQYAGVPYP